ncbi:hypothetical protein A4V11_09655 [Pediococcus acidilactici]|uniref:glycosyltransferase family 2 protein n=1 Tax=Pediococcus acidilactici TaxID=1254 RepID=UPI0008787112|nr:glycosyltransferase family 2 protein [Pediococcus acidilactici]AOW75272.1 hypothetical protein A4V11_09655 [Pediococcus acidilactici]
METKVTIIIPTHNNQDTIERAIESCRKQDFYHVEILVIDNGSTDQTKEKIFEIIQKDERVKYFYTDQIGRSNARNIGIKRAKGKYIKFLDADDSLTERGLQESVLFLEHNTDYKAFCGSTEYVDLSSSRREIKKIPENINELQFHNLFPINSILIRNEDLIFFENDLDYCEDWLFWFDNLWSKKIYIDNKIVCGRVFITGKNSMKNVKLMSRFRVIVRAQIIKKINYKPYMYFSDLKYCLTYLWSYKNGEERIQCLEDKMYQGYEKLFLLAKVLYKIPIFKSLYDRKKNIQESNNAYFKK